MLARTALLCAAATLGLSLAQSAIASVDPLPRRVWHGLVLEPGKPDEAAPGALISTVVKDGTGSLAGVKPGDRLLSVNQTAVESVATLTSGPLRTLPAGSSVTYVVLRDGKEVNLTRKAMPRVAESKDGIDVIYDAVEFGGGKLRTLFTKPKRGGPFPAVLLIQGYPCNSIIDAPPTYVYRRMTEYWAEQGIASLRVDKPGVGDGVGPLACEGIDLNTEAEAFKAALRALKQRPEVKADQVFIFGHSLGGIIGPMIAPGDEVRGMVVYGTLHVPWFEYFYQALRVQSSHTTDDFLALEKDMRGLHRLVYALMVEKKTPQELIAADKANEALLKEHFSFDGKRGLFGRDVSLFWQLNDVNLVQAWLNTKARVLVTHGAADIQVMSNESPRTIVRMVNRQSAGQATYCEFPRLNHSFAAIGSAEQEYLAVGKPDYGKVISDKYDAGYTRYITTWMKQVASGSKVSVACPG